MISLVLQKVTKNKCDKSLVAEYIFLFQSDLEIKNMAEGFPALVWFDLYIYF